jgi:hypothetical protein
MSQTIGKLLTRATTLLYISSQLEVCIQRYGPRNHKNPNFGISGLPLGNLGTK